MKNKHKDVDHEVETAAFFRCEECRTVIAGVPFECPSCEVEEPGYKRVRPI